MNWKITCYSEKFQKETFALPKGILAHFLRITELRKYQDAALCAKIMEDRRRAGRALDDHFPDVIIASTARARNLVLVARNISEFEDMGLKLIDPWMT